MKRQWLFLMVALFFVVGLTMVLSVDTAMAQTEICNDGIDNDGDKLADCADPDCATDPACTKKTTADCSPGYYKNHPNTWDASAGANACCTGQSTDTASQCGLIAFQLCAECGATSWQRAAAKEFLDECFGTAEASPCRDDD
jgi:hypothetical protein